MFRFLLAQIGADGRGARHGPDQIERVGDAGGGLPAADVAHLRAPGGDLFEQVDLRAQRRGFQA